MKENVTAVSISLLIANCSLLIVLFPMGKVKASKEIEKNYNDLKYQFPMGKVKLT